MLRIILCHVTRQKHIYRLVWLHVDHMTTCRFMSEYGIFLLKVCDLEFDLNQTSGKTLFRWQNSYLSTTGDARWGMSSCATGFSNDDN